MEHRWTAHPVAGSPRVALLGAGIILAFAGVIAWSFDSPWWGLVSVMLLVGSTGGFWFRTTYWVDAEGVGWQRLGGRRARRWPQLRRAEEFGGEAGGVMLSPYLRPTSLDRVRSVELRWAGNREVVLAAVREGMGERRDPG